MVKEVKDKPNRGKIRDLGMTYIDKDGGKKPDWWRKGKVPPKGTYPELEDD